MFRHKHPKHPNGSRAHMMLFAGSEAQPTSVHTVCLTHPTPSDVYHLCLTSCNHCLMICTTVFDVWFPFLNDVYMFLTIFKSYVCRFPTPTFVNCQKLFCRCIKGVLSICKSYVRRCVDDWCVRIYIYVANCWRCSKVIFVNYQKLCSSMFKSDVCRCLKACFVECLMMCVSMCTHVLTSCVLCWKLMLGIVTYMFATTHR
jgi:hypothetical protein